MDYDLAFGKLKLQKKAMRLMHKKNITLNKAWREVLKASSKPTMSKNMLDKMSLKRLQKLAKKHKVSVHKKGTKVLVKKSTLLKRLKSNRSIKKILESASRMKKSSSPKRAIKSAHFGNTMLKANTPNFYAPLELSLGQTYDAQRRHYLKIPTTLISQNFQGPGVSSAPGKNVAPKNFHFTRGSLGRSSLPPFYQVSDPKHPNNRFGRYFH